MAILNTLPGGASLWWLISRRPHQPEISFSPMIGAKGVGLLLYRVVIILGVAMDGFVVVLAIKA